ITTYFRQEFDFDGNPSATTLSLDLLVDDGAVVYLNGMEVYRHNMAAGNVNANTLASIAVGDADWLQSISIPADSLQVGNNVLAVELHQAAAADVDLLFAATLTSVTAPPTVGSLDAMPIVLNELSAAGNGPFTAEIINAGDAPANIGLLELHLPNGAREVIPANTVLQPQSRLVIHAAAENVLADGDRVDLVDPANRHVLDSALVTTDHQARIPEATGDWLIANTTWDAVNTANLHDEIVINEVMYHFRPHTVGSNEPQSEYQEVDEEWIELFNRSDRTVDLSNWQFDDAISYTFPVGTTMAPGGYLVITNDTAQLKAKYPELSSIILGDYDGRLNNTTDHILLLDAIGNPADSVEYYQDGQWPSAADGAGASLELRDPNADNSRGLAWAASDELANSSWQTISYRGVVARSSVGADTQWSELVLGLLSDGIILLDDISVIQDPDGEALELVQNGSFDGDTVGPDAAKWRLLGNHGHSQVIVDPSNPANQVLKFVATGATEHMHNHVETTMMHDGSVVRITNGKEYQISFKAKWVSGSNLLNSRLYFNRLAQTTAIARPERSGTPGRQNSRAESNLGPTYANFIHSPAVPAPGQDVTVHVTANDVDSVGAVTLWYSVAGQAWQSTVMTANGDDYQAKIPGQAAGTLVQFYVLGVDGQGNATTFPRDGVDSRAMFQVDDGLASDTGLHNLRLIITKSDSDYMHSRTQLMSNDRVGATLIYDESEIFYDAGLRLSGSQRARPVTARLA
ncbi:MAG: lamin tail domain-containing protein, partial [Planctomycetales bacterium]|nr:lamin tail domain-containing protein [Planctomycetales bacterium]